MKILHIVRRYGPVGGMERYVWELSRELVALGHQVEVLCERCHTAKPSGIVVHELGEIASRPRWLSLTRFNLRVASWLNKNQYQDYVIHSNERLSVHHLTTFHSPPFANVRDQPFWKRLSLRVAMQLYLEWRELNVAQVIVPNSSVISTQIAHYYPQFSHKLARPITPGVVLTPRQWHPAPENGGIIAFVGKEWKRKGLAMAVRIVEELKVVRPELQFWVVGPQPKDIKHLFEGWDGGYQLLGWRRDFNYLQVTNVLLHPAKSEPYGMVISEAMAAQIPVVVSNTCGASADVNFESGSVLALQDSIPEWLHSLQEQLQRKSAPPVFSRNWKKVACEYEAVYRQCIESNVKADAGQPSTTQSSYPAR